MFVVYLQHDLKLEVLAALAGNYSRAISRAPAHQVRPSVSDHQPRPGPAIRCSKAGDNHTADPAARYGNWNFDSRKESLYADALVCEASAGRWIRV